MGRSSISDLARLAAEIRACTTCVTSPIGAPLPHAPRPVLRVSSTARLLIAGQAPGTRVHRSGQPFTDPSGDRLRAWMGIDSDTFYDESRIAIVPMGFCFPGLDASGSDLPPRRECRALWHDRLMDAMPQIETILVIGRYAQDYHFARAGRPLPKMARVDDIVRGWRGGADATLRLFPLPHPSWRNSGWLKRNDWFERELLPDLRARVAQSLALHEMANI